MKTRFILPAAALVALGGAAVAMGDGHEQTASQTLDAGSLSIQLDAFTGFANVTVPATDTDNSGASQIKVTDTTGSGDGWNATISATNFVLDGGPASHNIANTNFQIDAAVQGDLDVMNEHSANVADPTVLVTADTALGGTVAVLEAAVGDGQGEYDLPLSFTLTIPAFSQAGTYESTVTSTVNSGPTPE